MSAIKKTEATVGSSTAVTPPQRKAVDVTAPNQRILVVEDEPGIADAYVQILKPSGSENVVPMRRTSRSAAVATEAPKIAEPTKVPERFEVTVVHNAEDAMNEVKKAVAAGKPFTMGFFDVLLGSGMDGIELVKHVNEIDPNMYAVFVTAYSDRGVDSIQSFLGDKNTTRWDYLNKPFSQGEILQKARNGVAFWNLQREKQLAEDYTANLQRQLFDSERSATMATVARGIGHEFRNILTLIIGKAELSTHLQTTDALKDSMKLILNASYKASDVLKRFNYLHNPQDQKVVKRFMPASKPLEEALLLMNHQIRDNRLQICWIRKKSCFVEGNGTSLMQVFVNLLINSMHAMGKTGQVDLSVQQLDDVIEIRFRDFGPGCDPNILNRITDPFFTTKGEQGTGLGLSISKEIIEEEHGGTFKISNHEVKGLEVVITLPAVKERVPQGSEAKDG
ncbi:MAG: ATP-binding protein [Bdellovibrionota bacterium]